VEELVWSRLNFRSTTGDRTWGSVAVSSGRGVAKMHFQVLDQEVVESDLCCGCGSCVATCPFKVLEIEGVKPKLIGECKSCGVCHAVCPSFRVDCAEVESFVFGRTRREDEDFGEYQELQVAKAVDQEIAQACQDGGVVTSMLAEGLDTGLLDGVIASRTSPNRPMLPLPAVARTRAELLACAGSRYFRSANMLALRDAVSMQLGRLALVGTPCHVLAARLIQMVPIRKYSERISVTVGLFCMETFRYEETEAELERRFGLGLQDVVKTNIKGKYFKVYDRGGGEHLIPLNEIKLISEAGCAHCGTFAADYADVSVGAAGLTGLNLVVLRTERGKVLFENAVKAGRIETRSADEFKASIGTLKRLSALKARRLVSS